MKRNEYIPEAVILANGDYPSHPLPLRILSEAAFVICCDGAANRYISSGHVPDAIIGDNDSLLSDYRKRFASIFYHVKDQETNDQTKAIHFLAGKGFRRIGIVGATGKREDHTLGNISLLIDYMRLGLEVRSITDYGIFIPAHGRRTFTSLPGQQVSIFNFGAKGLHGENLTYPLRDFDSWWQGTLNEASSDEFTLSGEGDYLVFLAYDVKERG